MKHTVDSMSRRYWEVTDQRAAILAELEPLQDDLQKTVADNREDQKLRERIKKVRAPLYDLDMERSLLARALNGKVDLGERPAD